MRRALALIAAALVSGVPLAGGPANAAAGPGGERIGRVTAVTGQVSVIRPGTASAIQVAQKGLTIENPFLQSGDQVVTGSRSSAHIEFLTGKPGRGASGFDLGAAASVKLDRIASDNAAPGRPAVGFRKIVTILAGQISGDVHAAPDETLEFKTPIGVCAVKGTEVRFTVGSDNMVSLEVISGSADVTTNNRISFNLSNQAIAVADLPTGWRFTYPARSGDPIILTTPDGLRVSLPSVVAADTSVTINDDAQATGGGTVVTSSAGNAAAVTVTTTQGVTASVPQGSGVTVNDNTTAGAVIASNEGSAGAVTVTTTEGVTATLPPGSGVTVDDSATAGAVITSNENNTGVVTLTTTNGTVATLPAGSGVNVNEESSGTTLTLTSGTTTITQPSGEQTTLTQPDSIVVTPPTEQIQAPASPH